MLKLFGLLAVALPSVGAAQIANFGDRSYQSQVVPGAEAFVEAGHTLNDQPCLIEKKTHRRVCHTMEEWRKVAAQMTSDKQAN